MPELPEVEVLVRHLGPLVRNQTIKRVEVRREKVLAPTTSKEFLRKITGTKIVRLERRGKYLLFHLRTARTQLPLMLVGHLGMTGRMFVTSKDALLPKHAAVILDFGRGRLVYEDTRYFGRMTLEAGAIEVLGPEPLGGEFTAESFAKSLKRSQQAIKVKLLDQSLVAGVGNIYASEALFRARISPRLAASRLTLAQVGRLWRAIREVLTDAIRRGSTIPLSFSGASKDGLFYFGRAEGTPDYYEERLRVYDRNGKPCVRCKTPIKRIVQAARSTFFCPRCQAAAIGLR